jgi:hypothetical protein
MNSADIELIDADSIKLTISILEKFLIMITPQSKGGKATKGNKTVMRIATKTLLEYYKHNAIPITYFAYFANLYTEEERRGYTPEEKEKKRDQVRNRIKALKTKIVEFIEDELQYDDLILYDYDHAVIARSGVTRTA